MSKTFAPFFQRCYISQCIWYITLIRAARPDSAVTYYFHQQTPPPLGILFFQSAVENSDATLATMPNMLIYRGLTVATVVARVAREMKVSSIQASPGGGNGITPIAFRHSMEFSTAQVGKIWLLPINVSLMSHQKQYIWFC